MFTGIVEEIGKISSIKKGIHSAILNISANVILKDIHIGDSIAVNGICLTVTDFTNHSFFADVMHETINRTALHDLTTGSYVNLERAMPANGRFGGHIVSGHIDGVGEIINIKKDDNAIIYHIKTSKEIMKYIVEKGSITIDGISLTVAKTTQESFSISAIPHTVEVTTLGLRKTGDQVNLEVDIIGKYVEKLLKNPDQKSSNITMDFLEKCGF